MAIDTNPFEEFCIENGVADIDEYLDRLGATGNPPPIQRLKFDRNEWSPCSFDLTQKEAIPLGVLYNAGRRQYLMLSAENTWIGVSETAVKRHLQQEHKLSDKAPKKGLSEVDRVLHEITRKIIVNHAGTLPGYENGVYELEAGNRMLVTSSPALIQPRKGDFPTIRKLLEEQLGPEQLPYLYGWLSVAYKSLRDHTLIPGQVLVFAGPPDCGKTFDQHFIITPILGGRDASPYQYMIGRTPFNSDLFGGEHLVVSDQVPHTDLASRRAFGSAIKDFSVNPKARAHPKHQEPFSVKPFWRMTISTSEEPEYLKILPPLDDSIQDELSIFKFNMPKSLPPIEKRQEFLNRIMSEMPAFVHFLLSYEIQADRRSKRFGIIHYHNPELVVAIDNLAPENELLELIDRAIFNSPVAPNQFEGTAEQIAIELKGPNSPVQWEAKNLIGHSQTCGLYLSRLSKKHAVPLGRKRVFSRVLRGKTIYRIENAK